VNRLQRRWRDFEIRLQKSTRVQGALRRLFAAYVNFVFRTTRWERIGFESYEADIARGIPRVLCCWHERLMFTPYLRDWTDHGLTVIEEEVLRHAEAHASGSPAGEASAHTSATHGTHVPPANATEAARR